MKNERIILSVSPDELSLIQSSLNLSAAFIAATAAFQGDIRDFQSLAGRIGEASETEEVQPVNGKIIPLSSRRRQVSI